MKDFAKSVRTNNADLGLRPVVPQLVKDIAKIYEANGKDREKTKQELIQKHHMSERQAEDVLRQIVGNSKVGNYITDLMGQANEYSKGFSEALKKGDKAEAEKVSGYAKILKRQIKEEREEIQKRLKDLDNAERIMGSVGNSKPKVGNSATYDRLENAISVIYTYYHMANRQLESGSFSATNCINALSHIKQACDEAIKLAQQYDREINK